MDKVCTKCGDTKLITEFSLRTDTGKYRNQCKTCKRHMSRAYCALNAPKARTKASAWYYKNRDYVLALRRQERTDKPDKVKAAQRADYLKHRDQYIYRARKRELHLLTAATPKWLTPAQKDEIKNWYNLAKELQWLSDEQLQVDHIIPLQGANVSGLHVPWNLQILPRTENLRKGNRL